MKNSVWTDKKIEKLKKLYEKGLSTAEIGKKLDVSKNSVIGKIHRLGLSKNKTESKEKKSTIKSIFGFMKKESKGKKSDKKDEVEKVSKKTITKEKDSKTESKKVEKKSSSEKQKVEKKTKVVKNEVENTNKKDTKKSKSSNLGPKETYTLQMLKSDMCRWPSEKPNKDGMFLFCGAKTENKKTYCEKHMKEAYLSQEEQKNKKANKINKESKQS